MVESNKDLYARRRDRNRIKIKNVKNQRPRLSVHRSNLNIYAQIIDDLKGKTLASASTLDKDLKKNIDIGSNKKAAREVGLLIGKRAMAAGIKEVIFDRGGHIYHGRIKEVAEGAREGGLKF